MGAAMAGEPARVDRSPTMAVTSASSMSGATSGPAALAAAVLPPMPGPRADLTSSAGLTTRSSVQRAPIAPAPAADGRPNRLTVGQARRLGLGTPFSGSPPVMPVVARSVEETLAPIAATSGPTAPERPGPAAAPSTSATATPADESPATVSRSIASSPAVPAILTQDVQRTSIERAPLVSRAPMAGATSPGEESDEEPGGGPTVARSALSGLAGSAPRRPSLGSSVQRSTSAAGDDHADHAGHGDHRDDAESSAPAGVQRATAAAPAPIAEAPEEGSASPALASLVSRQPLVSRSVPLTTTGDLAPSPDEQPTTAAASGVQRFAVAAANGSPEHPLVARSPSNRVAEGEPGFAASTGVSTGVTAQRAATALASPTPGSAIRREVRPIVSRQPSLLAPSTGADAADEAPSVARSAFGGGPAATAPHSVPAE
jgi:hypothetical protein